MVDQLGDATTKQPESLSAPLVEALDQAALDCEMTCKMPEQQIVGMHASDMAELLAMSHAASISKQERDFALAALLVRGRHLSERSLRNTLKSWTPFGKIPLRDVIQEHQLVPEEALNRVANEAEEYLKKLGDRQTRDTIAPTVALRTSYLLDRLDPTGTVAKLFGFSQIPKALVGNEARTYRNHFRLIRKLGQGGLGTVWLAVDLSLNRYVAIKEITEQMEHNPAAMARFRREAEITGKLDHPSIVPIHMLGENDEDGRVFYVMRFLGNQTLSDAIRNYHERRLSGQDDPLEFHRLLTAFVSVCQAVAYAHSNRVIHRDLKPQNIALDSFGQVIVLDWGLAKMLGMEDPQAHVRDTSKSASVDNMEGTLASQVLGTPMYMAPEQASGRSDEVDERTDVYGLGAILFAILTGYGPHEMSHDSLAAGSQLTDLLDAIVNRPSALPRSLNSKITHSLEAVCLKAIAKDRQTRYPTASALSEDVQRWLANEPVTAVQEPLPKRMRRWMQNHSLLSRGIALMIVTLAVGAGFKAFTSYQSTIAAEQLRLQTTVDIIRDLRAKLISEVQTLSENTHYMSTLPPVQGIVEARKAGANQDVVWVEHLQKMYRGLLEVHPNYTAVTYWTQEGLVPGKTVRVENAIAQRGMQRTDLTEFFGRHLPEIVTLRRHEIYVGMPGRMVKLKHDEAPNPFGLPPRGPEPVGHCFVSGVLVFDKDGETKIGGVSIESDLEQILVDHLNMVYAENIKLYLTDNHGRCIMQFTRENGLRSVETGQFSDSVNPQLHAYFMDPLSPKLKILSSKLCAAKVPLSQHRPDHFMGLILQLDDDEKTSVPD